MIAIVNWSYRNNHSRISPESPIPLWMQWPRLAPPSEQTTYPYEREVRRLKRYVNSSYVVIEMRRMHGTLLALLEMGRLKLNEEILLWRDTLCKVNHEHISPLVDSFCFRPMKDWLLCREWNNRHAGGQSVFVSDLAEFINLPGIYSIPLPLPKGWEPFTLAG